MNAVTTGPIRYCLTIFLIVRVALGILAAVGVGLLPPNDPISVPGWAAPTIEGGWHNIVTAWERWDALWFLRIATDGYDAGDGSAAFFPLYPVLIAVLSFVFGGPLSAALVISNVAFLAALIVVYRLTEDEYDAITARRTVLYIAVFPAALFFFAPYSESLFLLLSASCFWAARRGNWGIAGVTGALAALTRNTGLLLAVALLIEGIRRYRLRPEGNRLDLYKSLGASALVGVGFFAYLAFWGANGNWSASFDAQGNWLREFTFFPATIIDATRDAWGYVGIYPVGFHFLDWVIVIPMLVAAGWVVWRTPLPYGIYTLLALLVPLSFPFGDRPFMSVPRFMAVLFPLFWALARAAERFKIHEAIVATSAALLGVMTILFVNWYWVF